MKDAKPDKNDAQDPRPSANPAAMGVAQAASILGRMGCGPVEPGMIEADIEAGAPTNGDGTINLVHYAAWLVRQLAQGDGDGD